MRQELSCLRNEKHYHVSKAGEFYFTFLRNEKTPLKVILSVIFSFIRNGKTFLILKG